MMVIYLIGPVVFGQMQSMLAETVFASLALIGTFLSPYVIEAHIEKSVLNLGFMCPAIFLSLLSLAQFIFFIFDLPGLTFSLFRLVGRAFAFSNSH